MLPTPCVCTKLRRSARALTALYDQALAPSGLSAPQFALLRTLGRLGPVALCTMAVATGHDRTTLNRTLRPLESAGLIRSQTGDDHRRRILALTDVGAEAIAAAQPHWEKVQRRIAAMLGAEHAQLFAILDRLEEIHP